MNRGLDLLDIAVSQIEGRQKAEGQHRTEKISLRLSREGGEERTNESV
jgi:hypothetical protein